MGDKRRQEETTPRFARFFERFDFACALIRRRCRKINMLGIRPERALARPLGLGAASGLERQGDAMNRGQVERKFRRVDAPGRRGDCGAGRVASFVRALAAGLAWAAAVWGLSAAAAPVWAQGVLAPQAFQVSLPSLSPIAPLASASPEVRLGAAFPPAGRLVLALDASAGSIGSEFEPDGGSAAALPEAASPEATATKDASLGGPKPKADADKTVSDRLYDALAWVIVFAATYGLMRLMFRLTGRFSRIFAAPFCVLGLMVAVGFMLGDETGDRSPDLESGVLALISAAFWAAMWILAGRARRRALDSDVPSRDRGGKARGKPWRFRRGWGRDAPPDRFSAADGSIRGNFGEDPAQDNGAPEPGKTGARGRKGANEDDAGDGNFL